jgi:hypothetical protein
MKNFLLTLVSFLHVVYCFPQKSASSVFISMQNNNVAIEDIVTYYDKGYYIENVYYTTFGVGNSWNIKTKANIESIWEYFVIHNYGNPVGHVAIIDSVGCRYLGGALYGTGTSTPLLVKYNPCGEQEWCVLIPEAGFGHGLIMDILINKSNELIVAILYLNPSNTSYMEQVFLAAFNAQGDLLWKNAFASPLNHPHLRNPFIYQLKYINNEYYLSGYCYYAYTSNPDLFILTPLFVGIDSLFNEKWILPFGMFDNIRGDAFASIHLNDTIIMGIGYQRSGSSAWGLLMFYSFCGNIIGYSQLDNELIQPTISSQFRNVEMINDSLFVINGLYEPVYQSIYNMDFVVDASCSLYHYQPRPNAIGLSSLIKTHDNNFIVGTSHRVGNAYRQGLVYKFDENLQPVPFDTTTYVYDSLCPYPIQSGTIDLTGCMVLTSTDWIPTPREYYARISAIPITIYPNPASDHITFALENTEHHRNIELRCFNLLGVQQHQTKILRGQQQATANVSAWPPGMYVVVVYSDGRPVGRGKFVVQR